MRYEGLIYRRPSEAESWILQATIGCSWNACTYCDMYRHKRYRVRERAEIEEDIALAAAAFGPEVRKVFVADGDAEGRVLQKLLHVALLVAGLLAAPAGAGPELETLPADLVVERLGGTTCSPSLNFGKPLGAAIPMAAS